VIVVGDEPEVKVVGVRVVVAAVPVLTATSSGRPLWTVLPVVAVNVKLEPAVTDVEDGVLTTAVVDVV
jgi:hypothetical protein